MPGMSKPVRVCTDPNYYEENSDSVELWSPGNPLMPPNDLNGESEILPPVSSLRELLTNHQPKFASAYSPRAAGSPGLSCQGRPFGLEAGLKSEREIRKSYFSICAAKVRMANPNESVSAEETRPKLQKIIEVIR
jgi:hypothetical protein